jgi:signal transduction histidine kinase
LALRARVSLAFALLGLLLIAVLATTTYALVRTYLLDQRQDLATRQAFLNARVAKTLMSSESLDPQRVFDQLEGEVGTASLLHIDGRWYASSVGIGPDSVPDDMQAMVDGGGASRRRVDVGGVPHAVVGTPIVSLDGQYFEFAPLRELDRTLRVMASSLAVASGITAIAAAGVGWYASRRLLRPLERVSLAAVDIAGGRLDTRLDDEGDRDLEPLVTSFNEMVAALQLRLEREARFASDVSHEMRTPLTALATAVQVVRARADDLPSRTRLAVAVLETQIAYFQRLVLDLLEISRFDVGAVELVLDDVDIEAFVRTIASDYGVPDFVVQDGMETSVAIDRRRVERVLVNLLDNAERYAGGATRVEIARDRNVLRLAVEDDGPGVPEMDRLRVFDRFWRGPGSRSQAVKGTGLGLALVSEHGRVHGGRVRIESAAGGGSRFVVELPVGPSPLPVRGGS